MSKAAKRPKRRTCLFCDLRRPGDDVERLILMRRKEAFLMLNAYPYNTGHLMVAVRRHEERISDLEAAERNDLWTLAGIGELAVQDVYHPEGLNAGINLGRSAGAGVEGHLHLHIVPRWSGDTNFMTTVGETKVLPEVLSVTYQRLHDAIRARRRRGGRKTGARSRAAKR